MKDIRIITKIKILGALLLLSILIVTSVTIYLNQKNIKDALIINIAGKQRMFTQKITKEVLYIYQNRQSDFVELDNAVSDFIDGFNTIKNGNQLLAIIPHSSKDIHKQILVVTPLWSIFLSDVEKFKNAMTNNDIKAQKLILNSIYNKSAKLLYEVDLLVMQYTKYIENKTNFIKLFQYLSITIILLLSIYSILKLQVIQRHANELLRKSKEIGGEDLKNLKQLNIQGEREIIEVANNINCFIDKVADAMQHSNIALEQSKKASEKIENLTYEIRGIIEELEGNKSIEDQLDKSEYIVTESTETLQQSTKKLAHLKGELDTLLDFCKKSNI